MQPSETFQRLLRGIEVFEDLNQAIREEAVAVVGRGDHLEIIHFFYNIGKIYDTLSDMKKGYNALWDGFSQEHIPDVLRSKNVKNLTVDDLDGSPRRIQMSNRWACSITDKDRGFQWLRENGLGDLIKPSVHAQTLAATAKDLMETSGKEMPQDIFKTSINTFSSIVKAK